MMKRKQVEEDPVNGHDNEPSAKKSRSSARATSNSEEDDRQGENSSTPVKRRYTRQDSSSVEEDQDTIPSGAGVEGGIEQGELEGELKDGTRDDSESENVTPRKRKRGRPRKDAGQHRPNGATPKKDSLLKTLFSTPVKENGATEADTPRIERNADRSARRNSTRTLIERTILGTTSDNDEEEEEIAEEIYNSEEEGIVDEDGLGLLAELAEDENTPATPSKRGRKKGSKNKQKSPTPPPQDLTPHEKYFYQNRGGRVKTSNNTLSSLALLDHEEYFSRARNLVDPHARDIEYLEDLHAESFNQWHFELSQDFNICLYGWGSKKSLLMKFADHIYQAQSDHTKAKIVVVNGYVHNLTLKDILNTIAVSITERGYKLGSQPADMLDNLLALLEKDKAHDITLIIHSIDRVPLRRQTTQTLLSRLASHPQVHLIASADHPSFPLLWDSSLRSTYNFVFHDCTTFQPYTAEIDVVDEVHELLGRSGRRVGGKEGVSFVLKSLPENAKNLFRVLIGEQLAAMDDSGGALEEVDDDDDHDERRVLGHKKNEAGVEYRVLYNKAVEEFICSNEMNFRTLLKEFHDHQMIVSRKDVLGTEMLSVPFRKEELETILEDIVS
ncbi:ORC2-domain-containing protein [Hyaloscypha variabilis F]|uniref:Origin recognition complex subunit 2 n=1 Tax=Hyaloscypha variabilis (strain UAMH 11265 / GT02V1 / F) TaxID=1149755 RepID=A0A2J6RYV3_HYAVF|nr:ORC2-domain-containing protein [Hyaloscypha variabilis F]